jgi:hypothetical protein
MSARRTPRLGHTPLGSKIATYAVLLVLVGVDYLLLSQSLILLNAASSETASVGVQMYIITLGFTAMMVAIPHTSAVIARRVTDGLFHRRWLLLIGAMLLIWVSVLALVTVMRIRAGAAAAQSSALEGLGGLEPSTPEPDPFGPETLMALLTVFFVTSTGVLSWYAAYHASRPLLAALERAEAQVQQRREAEDAAQATVTQAEGDLATAEEEDPRDAVRLSMAKSMTTERLTQLRSQVATLIAENDGSPESTSEMIRNLRDLVERRSDQSLAS